jgi:hypothetical protein
MLNGKTRQAIGASRIRMETSPFPKIQQFPAYFATLPQIAIKNVLCFSHFTRRLAACPIFKNQVE